jgi:hypothetical protein
MKSAIGGKKRYEGVARDRRVRVLCKESRAEKAAEGEYTIDRREAFRGPGD